jgi:hypothetical protein
MKNLVIESLKEYREQLNESFWINVVPYKGIDKNGEKFLNVSGVPGGFDNDEEFLVPLDDVLDKNKRIITQQIVDYALKLHRSISPYDAIMLKKDLKFSDKEWLANLWGERSDYEDYPPEFKMRKVDDEYNHPEAAYLIWYLKKNIGKKITKFSY